MQKLGVREICEVVLKAKATMKVGNKIFYKNEPVVYFDTLKTSSLEGAATQVYAQGGQGNARLIGWEGERTVTFTMEDALISPESFMILSGAGLIEPTAGKTIKQHVVESLGEDFFTVNGGVVSLYLEKKPYLPEDKKDNFAYVMAVDHETGSMSEPFIPVHGDDAITEITEELAEAESLDESLVGRYRITVEASHDDYVTAADDDTYNAADLANTFDAATCHILVDYYTEKAAGARQIEITPEKFGGNFYLEASTLFRDTNGVDLPAEFVIPNCKIQSNFSFTMAATGDPSSFTFTMDAFPDYTRFDHSHKVLCAIQIIDAAGSANLHRTSTEHAADDEKYF